MKRREVTVLATLLLTKASIAHAQPAERVWSLGFISSGYSTSSSLRLIPAELASMGYVEGRNLILESRFAEGAPERLPILAREMAGRSLDAIIAVSNPAIRAVKEAAPTTPIVMAFAGEDPVAAGLVSSLNRPGGTVTSVTVPATEMDAKRIELVAQAMPDIKRIALLTTRYAEQDRTLLARNAAQALGLDLIIVTAANKLDYDAAFKAIASANVTALVIGSSPVFFRDVTELTARASTMLLPTICEWRDMAEAGCLLSFGPNRHRLYRRVATYVARIFRGEQPRDLPVEQPDVFELIINLQTARALNVTFHSALLARADEVIE